MESTFDDLIQYVRNLGAAEVEHSDVTYLGHLAGVYRDLKAWSCSEDVCRGGMFHSIYGTEIFRRFALPLDKRDEVRELIGERAEWLAYLNSAIDYASFDEMLSQSSGPRRMLDRFTGQHIELSADDLEDLALIHLCDRLEQAPRSKDWEFRPTTFSMLAKRLGGVAAESYERVYGIAPAH